MMLALSWEKAEGFPPEVTQTLESVATLGLEPFEFLFAFPEHKTHLPGGSRASQSDVLAIARSGSRLSAIAVEGKVDEGFDRPVAEWLGSDPTPGRQERLAFLCGLLGVDQPSILDIPYQLVHRTGSAVIEARRLNAMPMMLVHSWGSGDEGFDDYARFLRLMGANATIGSVSSGSIGDEQLVFAWVRGDERWRSVEA